VAIVWHYIHDPTFSRLDRIPQCDRQTDRQTVRHTTTAYTMLSIASRGKNYKLQTRLDITATYQTVYGSSCSTGTLKIKHSYSKHSLTE